MDSQLEHPPQLHFSRKVTSNKSCDLFLVILETLNIWIKVNVFRAEHIYTY